MSFSMKLILVIACLSAASAMKARPGFLTQMKTKNTDPKCRTGVLSVPTTADDTQVCCAGFCGTCGNSETCNAALQVDTDTSLQCCLSDIKANACGSGAPADKCIDSCSKTDPPCIMDEHAYTIPKTGIVDAGKDCNEAIYTWRKKSEAAIKDGERNGMKIQDDMNADRLEDMKAKHENDMEAYYEGNENCEELMAENAVLVDGFKTAVQHQRFRSVTSMMDEMQTQWAHLLNQSQFYFGVVKAQDEKYTGLLGDTANLAEAENEAQVMAKAFHDSTLDCKALRKFWELHEGHWVLDHVRTHIDERDNAVMWNPMPTWLLNKIGCDSDPSDGCDQLPLMYYPVAFEADYLHDAQQYSFEIKGSMTHTKAGEECAELCVKDENCMGGDVVVLEEEGEKALSCNLFSRPQAVAVSINAADLEGFYDRGFIKKKYWDRSSEHIDFIRGWTHCSWESPEAECKE